MDAQAGVVLSREGVENRLLADHVDAVAALVDRGRGADRLLEVDVADERAGGGVDDQKLA